MKTNGNIAWDPSQIGGGGSYVRAYSPNNPPPWSVISGKPNIVNSVNGKTGAASLSIGSTYETSGSFSGSQSSNEITDFTGAVLKVSFKQMTVSAAAAYYSYLPLQRPSSKILFPLADNEEFSIIFANSLTIQDSGGTKHFILPGTYIGFYNSGPGAAFLVSCFNLSRLRIV